MTDDRKGRIVWLNVNYLDGSTIFHTPAANAAPTKGPTMNIHRLDKAVPPWKSAGPMERAGLTDVPV